MTTTRSQAFQRPMNSTDRLGVPVAQRESAAPVAASGFDAVTDVVVVGGGGGGLPVALFSRWRGSEVILLEKASELGGTARKAAFWYWVPNNKAMQGSGMADTEDDFLRYVARVSRPTTYDPDAPYFGMSDWEWGIARGIYESAAPAAELLAEKQALPYRHVDFVPDYYAHLSEDKAPQGRVLIHRDAKESMTDGGIQSIRTMTDAAERDGVDIRLRHRVQRLITTGGAVVGVEASTPDGTVHRIGARKAVIFATGGFTHNEEMRQNFLSIPAVGGCAVVTNEGDFVAMATAVGAQLRNMTGAWMCPVPLEKAHAHDPNMTGMFMTGGDSLILVNKHGRRVVNEKIPYDDLAQSFYAWDYDECDYPNRVLVQIWDQRSQDHSAGGEFGRLITPPGGDDRHVLRGDTLEELHTALAERLARISHLTANFTLADDFLDQLRATINRFNTFAEEGVDEDFHRGEHPIAMVLNGEDKDEPERRNPTMWPISGSGPYYATLLAGGTLDTKGGPKTSPDGHVLDDMGTPIRGLYGVGNCVASASGKGYWGGGSTLGPIIALAYRAAVAADRENELALTQ
jgi:3-oxosteroid 1-dehydrogenase